MKLKMYIVQKNSLGEEFKQIETHQCLNLIQFKV